MSNELIFALKLIGIIVVSYFIGNINWAVIIARKKKTNIREQGSGNPGTMNMLRTFGIKTAILTLLLDILKGVIPCIASYYIMQIGPDLGFTAVDLSASPFLGYYSSGIGKLAMYVSGISAILGHMYPVIYKFKGGKGVGTTIGFLFTVNPLIMLPVFSMSVIYLVFGKYGSVASFISVIGGTIAEVVCAAVFRDNFVVIILSVLIMVTILWAHRENIKRLINGTERENNLRKKYRESKERKAAQKKANSEKQEHNFDEKA